MPDEDLIQVCWGTTVQLGKRGKPLPPVRKKKERGDPTGGPASSPSGKRPLRLSAARGQGGRGESGGLPHLCQGEKPGAVAKSQERRHSRSSSERPGSLETHLAWLRSRAFQLIRKMPLLLAAPQSSLQSAPLIRLIKLYQPRRDTVPRC